MINPEDATMIDARDSFSIDECVAKMIGWMQGAERLYRVELDEFCFPPDKLPHIYCLVYPLEKHLDQLQERARVALLEAADAYGNSIDGTPEHELLYDNLDLKHKAIEDFSRLVNKALLYKSEIIKELDKGDSSQLKIDHIDTDGVTNIIYIKLYSLDDWAWQNHEVAIIDRPSTMRSISAKSENDSPPTINNIVPQKLAVRTKLRDQEAAILESIKVLGYDPKNLPKRDGNKSGIKFLVRTALSKNKLFKGAKVFDKAWERLRSWSDIADSK